MKMKRSGWMMAGVMAVAIASAGAQQGGTSSSVKDDLFAGTEVFAKGASDINEITMDPDTLGMVGGSNSKRAHTMVLNVVRTYTYDKPGMYRIEDVDAFRNKLNTGDWHCSVHTRSLKTGESTDVCAKRRTDDMSETAIITVEPKELTFIHTIRKKGPGESEVSDMPLLLHMKGMGPEFRADMVIAQAEMKAHMAMMRPDMAIARAQMGAEMEGLLAGQFPLIQEDGVMIRLDGLRGLDQLKEMKHYDLKNVPGIEAPKSPVAPLPPSSVPEPPTVSAPEPIPAGTPLVIRPRG